jgi:hypothetical protein
MVDETGMSAMRVMRSKAKTGAALLALGVVLAGVSPALAQGDAASAPEDDAPPAVAPLSPDGSGGDVPLQDPAAIAPDGGAPAPYKPAPPPVVVAPPRVMTDMPVAILQGLDKVTARVSRLVVPVDTPTVFGTLTITVRACRKSAPEDTPEAAAFLEINDQRPDGPVTQVYSGWMFASSPALAAMELPTYDVWVLDCVSKDASSASTPAQ